MKNPNNVGARTGDKLNHLQTSYSDRMLSGSQRAKRRPAAMKSPSQVLLGKCLAGANKREVNSGEFTLVRYARETLSGGQLANVQ